MFALLVLRMKRLQRIRYTATVTYSISVAEIFTAKTQTSRKLCTGTLYTGALGLSSLFYNHSKDKDVRKNSRDDEDRLMNENTVYSYFLFLNVFELSPLKTAFELRAREV